MPKQRPGAGRSAPGRPARSLPDLPQQGLRHFQAGRLDQAIVAWEAAGSDPQVRAALAEAYFRRALAATDPQRRADDLRLAVAAAPREPRFHYHLGLALQRQGDLNGAQAHYDVVASANPRWPGLALVRALIGIERGEQADSAAAPGLNEAERAALEPLTALLRGEAPLAAPGDPLGTLWYGLGLLQSGNHAAAATALAEATPLPGTLARLRRYYLGLAEALGGNMATAVDHLQKLGDAPLRAPWMFDNMAAALYARLHELNSAGDLAGAAELARAGAALPLVNAALNELEVQLLDRAGQAAATRGEWPQATGYWEAARTILANADGLGSPRTLLHNLALAYEAQERWRDAADAWRAMLRTRPRRSGVRGQGSGANGTAERKTKSKRSEADAEAQTPNPEPQTLPLSDAQWSWVRRRVIECYKQAQAPGEAVTVFRQAIKAEPDDLDLRLQLADALLANEQPGAAHNEIQRLLEREPQHIEARLRLAGYYLADGHWYAAEQSLQVAVEQDPQREDLRRQLAQLLSQLGSRYNEFGRYDGAYKAFSEAARLAPGGFEHQINLARVAFNRKRPAEAHSHIEQALALAEGRPDAYVAAIGCWAIEGDLDEARKVLAQAEAALPTSPEFYLLAGVELLDASAPPPPPALFNPFGPPVRPQPKSDDEWAKLGIELLDRAAAMRPEDPGLRHRIASELLQVRPDIALRYIGEAVRLKPNDPVFQVLQGLLQGLAGDVKGAKDTLRKAIKLAKQQGNHELAASAEDLRRQIGSPFFGMAMQMGGMFGDLDEEELWF